MSQRSPAQNSTAQPSPFLSPITPSSPNLSFLLPSFFVFFHLLLYFPSISVFLVSVFLSFSPSFLHTLSLSLVPFLFILFLPPSIHPSLLSILIPSQFSLSFSSLSLFLSLSFSLSPRNSAKSQISSPVCGGRGATIQDIGTHI